MGYRKKTKSISKAISYVLLLLLIVAVIGVIGYFTNGFTSGFKTFYILHNDKTIMERGSVKLPNNEDVRFDVKYTFGMLNNDEIKGFSVKIVPNITRETDFEFTVDGSAYAYSGEKDLTSAFDIKLYEDYFTVNIHDAVYLGDFLAKVYTGRTAAVPKILAEPGYMTLIVTSYNGKSSVYIDLSVQIVVRIIIDGGDIVF